MYAVSNQDRDTEGDSMPGRRAGEQWSDPRVVVSGIQLLFSGCAILVALCGVAVVVFGGLLGSYVLMQTRDATSEISNAQLAQQVSAINVKMDKVIDVTNDGARDTAELKGAVQTLQRDLKEEAEERKGRDGWLEARIVSGK